jgi:osmotically-inducible protein OsmY
MIQTALPNLRRPSELTSDAALVNRVKLFLQAVCATHSQPMEIDARDGVVTVEGAVRSYYERQVAVACVRRVAGVLQVVDRIHVRDGDFARN